MLFSACLSVCLFVCLSVCVNKPKSGSADCGPCNVDHHISGCNFLAEFVCPVESAKSPYHNSIATVGHETSQACIWDQSAGWVRLWVWYDYCKWVTLTLTLAVLASTDCGVYATACHTHAIVCLTPVTITVAIGVILLQMVSHFWLLVQLTCVC